MIEDYTYTEEECSDALFNDVDALAERYVEQGVFSLDEILALMALAVESIQKGLEEQDLSDSQIG